MKIKRADGVRAFPVEMDGAEGVDIRLLVNEDDGAPNFIMRQFDVAADGHTPRHAHDWEHECYILSGSGVVAARDGEKPVSAGDCVYIPPGDEHQFRNTGAEPLRFLCLIPRSAG